jgi:hypothetical protein
MNSQLQLFKEVEAMFLSVSLVPRKVFTLGNLRGRVNSVGIRSCRSSSGQSLASHRGGPGSHPGSMWGLWWTKRHWGRFSPSTSVSPAINPPISPSLDSSGAGTISLWVAAVPSGPNWTPPPPTRPIKNNNSVGIETRLQCGQRNQGSLLELGIPAAEFKTRHQIGNVRLFPIH